MDIDAVYTALANAVNSAALNPHGIQVTATSFGPEALTVPHFFPAEFVAGYDKTFSGLVELTITARLMLSRADDENGQRMAQKLAGSGANTIYSALRAARGAPGQLALNGAASDVHLQRAQGPRLYQYGDQNYYGLEFTVFVMG